MDAEEKRRKLELDILQIVEEKLKSGNMDADRAKAIARMLLDKLHPPLTLEQIYTIAPTLDDEFKELTEAILPIMKEHDEKVRSEVSRYAEMLIKSGKIDQASALLKQALNKGVDV